MKENSANITKNGIQFQEMQTPTVHQIDIISYKDIRRPLVWYINEILKSPVETLPSETKGDFIAEPNSTDIRKGAIALFRSLSRKDVNKRKEETFKLKEENELLKKNSKTLIQREPTSLDFGLSDSPGQLLIRIKFPKGYPLEFKTVKIPQGEMIS
jgi:hypothetical protein